MTAPTPRSRSKPALSMNHLVDNSGGNVVETIVGVTAFHGSSDDLAGVLSSRKALVRIVDGVCEIIAKVAPGVALPIEANAVIPNAGDVVADDVGLSLEEANEARLLLNGYIATAAHLVTLYATAKGVTVPFGNHVGGDFMLSGDTLAPFHVEQRSATRPGLNKVEMDAALARWADCLATIAAVVNAAPDVPAPTTDASTNAE